VTTLASMSVIPDSEFGTRVRARLRDEQVIWLTTTADDSTPQPNPVWFLWEPDGDAVLVYCDNAAKRLDHVAIRPRVSLHFDSNGRGGNVVVFAGVAEQAVDAPPPDANDAYVTKYAQAIEGLGVDAAQFATKYSVPLRVRMTKVRGF
jgi:PPOX class probable F420-dependent enzyme